jgi:lipopolysaccharide/colanic/teichoic acid biosynthesis glycosyltransferase
MVARRVYFCGALALVFGAGWLHAVRLAPERYELIGSTALPWWIVFALAWLGISYAFGLPELAVSRLGAAGRGLAATVAAFAVIATFQSVLATPLLPRSASMILGLTLPVWTVVGWNLAGDARSRAAARDRVVLVVERSEDAKALADEDPALAERPWTLVGTVLVDEIADDDQELLLVERTRDAGATIVVLDSVAQNHESTVDQAAQLHREGVRVRTLSLFYEQWLGKLSLAELVKVSLLFDVGELHRARYVRVRRVIDVAFALLGLVALLPVGAVVAVLNQAWNRGPLLFRQARVGRNGEPFEILKFRSMAPGGDATRWTDPADARITPFGQVLRRTHLDELPQVINILRGDLSLVGPRPEQPHYVDQLRTSIGFYDVRHLIQPGLTGWAQTKQGYANGEDDTHEKLQYDVYYLRHQGLALDARIIWRTVRGVLGGDGR